MKNIHYILLFLLLNSCREPEKNSGIKTVVKEDASLNEIEIKPFANPVFFYASSTSFGNYFQSLYRLNHFNEMLDFTSTESRKKFGDKVLLGFYRNDFKLDFVLGKLTSIEKSGDTINLIYGKASIIARRKIVIPVLIESDSCKIIIRSLKNSLN